MNLDETDPTFVDDLLFSQEAVWIMAKWFSNRGFDACIPATKIRPDPSQRREFSDSGDLFIWQGNKEYKIEVKRRKIEFSSKNDFPYKTIIVNRTYLWDDADVKPYAHVILNQSGTAFFQVSSDTADRWTKTIRDNKKANRPMEFYECPIELCGFYKIER